jgi:hypothetical protein
VTSLSMLLWGNGLTDDDILGGLADDGILGGLADGDAIASKRGDFRATDTLVDEDDLCFGIFPIYVI